MRQNLLSWCTSWVEHWLLPPPWFFTGFSSLQDEQKKPLQIRYWKKVLHLTVFIHWFGLLSETAVFVFYIQAINKQDFQLPLQRYVSSVQINVILKNSLAHITLKYFFPETAIWSTSQICFYQGSHDADNLHYAALSINLPNRLKRQRKTQNECVYSSVKQ